MCEISSAAAFNGRRSRRVRSRDRSRERRSKSPGWELNVEAAAAKGDAGRDVHLHDVAQLLAVGIALGFA
jgi:hypothetical protein